MVLTTSAILLLILAFAWTTIANAEVVTLKCAVDSEHSFPIYGAKTCVMEFSQHVVSCQLDTFEGIGWVADFQHQLASSMKKEQPFNMTDHYITWRWRAIFNGLRCDDCTAQIKEHGQIDFSENLDRYTLSLTEKSTDDEGSPGVSVYNCVVYRKQLP